MRQTERDFHLLKNWFFHFHRSIAVYGCFAAGLTSLIIFAAISWCSGRVDTENTEEATNYIALSRGIRITVYLITALLAVASSVISLIEVDQTDGYIVPVRMYIQKYYVIWDKDKRKINWRERRAMFFKSSKHWIIISRHNFSSNSSAVS